MRVVARRSRVGSIPNDIQVLPDFHRQLSTPLFADPGKVLRDTIDGTSSPLRGLGTLTSAGVNEDGVESVGVGENLAGFPQLVTDGPYFIGHVDTETHNENSISATMICLWSHSINDHVAQLADSWSVHQYKQEW